MTGTARPPDPGRSSPGFHRALLEHSLDVIVVVDDAGRVTYASPGIERLVGYPPEARVGRVVFDLIHPADRAAQEQLLGELLADPGRRATGEFRVQHRDGGWRWLQGVGRNMLEDPEVAGILVNLRDVTDLREAEAELGRALGLLQEVVDHAPLVLWRVDAEGVFELSEGRGLQALGLEPGEVVGRNVFDVYADNPEALALMRTGLGGEEREVRLRVARHVFEARVRPVWRDGEVVGAVGVAVDVTEWAREADRSRFQARLLDQVGEAVIATDPDGAVIYWNDTATELYGWRREEALGRSVVELTVPEIAADEARAIMERLRAGDRWSGDYVVQRKDGSTFPVYLSNVPVFEGGELVAIIGVSTDVTERRSLEAQLRQAQKMEAVGQLAGGIAHDFNNLLTTIGGYAALAAERTEDPQVGADLKEILGATARARGLADKLLAFSRRRTARVEPVDLNAAVQGLAAMLKRTLGVGIRLRLELADRPWRVQIDPGLTEQAIMNLALNARDAMPGGGTLRVATDRVTLDPARARELEAGLEPGDYMRLVVEDTGSGIAADIRDRIFEPFFTTKEVGKGSGLGLSMVFGAVKQVGGGITVDSGAGDGSRFTLYFPRASADAERSEPEPEEASADGERTVLIVEDETAVLALARRVLDREGFRVLEATTGEEAWRVLEAEGEAVDLVVTDVIMPEMSGPELIQRVRRKNPSIRSLFMSGYTADELEARGLSREHENFLPKPFTPMALTAAVRGALED